MNTKFKALIMSVVLSLFVLSACVANPPQAAPSTAPTVPASVDNPAAGDDTMLAVGEPGQAVNDEVQNKAVEAVRKLLAEKLSLRADSLSLVAVEPIDWVDNCLGEPQEDELCEQVVTPGFRITFSHGDQIYTYHTDLAAGNIRQETAASQVS